MSLSMGKSFQNMFNLKDKIAIITGGAGLLGEGYAMALLEQGATVVSADLDGERNAHRVSQLAKEFPGRIISYPLDVTVKKSWQTMLNEVIQQFKRVDILVNNAGYTTRTKTAGYDASFECFSLNDWHGIIDVNLTGVFLGCQVIGEQMLTQSSGNIVNIASMYGLVSPTHRIYPGTGLNQPIAYSVSKSGVLAITRYLATLWAASGIRVNSITPGGIYDGQPDLFTQQFNALIPMGRMGDRSEIAGALIYLVSDAASYCTGHNLVVDGGWTLW